MFLTEINRIGIAGTSEIHLVNKSQSYFGLPSERKELLDKHHVLAYNGRAIEGGAFKF